MDAFETIVGTILRLDGYWTHHLFHVPLSKPEKRRIGLPSMPRPELDLVAYKPATNELLVVECKSYFNSRGVIASAFSKNGHRSSKRYKLFNDHRLWKTVRDALVRDLRKRGACRHRPRVTLCLAAGHIASEKDRLELHRLFNQHAWRLIDDIEIAGRLRAASNEGYADDVAILAAKILIPKNDRPDDRTVD